MEVYTLAFILFLIATGAMLIAASTQIGDAISDRNADDLIVKINKGLYTIGIIFVCAGIISFVLQITCDCDQTEALGGKFYFFFFALLGMSLLVLSSIILSSDAADDSTVNTWAVVVLSLSIVMTAICLYVGVYYARKYNILKGLTISLKQKKKAETPSSQLSGKTFSQVQIYKTILNSDLDTAEVIQLAKELGITDDAVRAVGNNAIPQGETSSITAKTIPRDNVIVAVQKLTTKDKEDKTNFLKKNFGVNKEMIADALTSKAGETSYERHPTLSRGASVYGGLMPTSGKENKTTEKDYIQTGIYRNPSLAAFAGR